MDLEKTKLLITKYLEQEIESIYFKKYSIVVITSSFVYKFYNISQKLFNKKSVYDEYIWDKKYDILNCTLITEIQFDKEEYNCIKMNRISYECLFYNILKKKNTRLIKDIIDLVKIEIELCEVAQKDKTEIYNDFLLNYEFQIEEINENWSNNLFFDIEVLKLLKHLFNSATERSFCIMHGDMFSENIFIDKGHLILLDPLSSCHKAKISYYISDLSTFMIDIVVEFLNDKKAMYFLIRTALEDYEKNDKILFLYYFILKGLVRYRFLMYEKNEKKDKNIEIIGIEKRMEGLKKVCIMTYYIIKKESRKKLYANI